MTTNLSDTIYTTINAEVQTAATYYAKRWPYLTREDMVQEGWKIACESIRRWDSSRALGPFLGCALRRQLLNWCYRMKIPVHVPRNREHEFAYIHWDPVPEMLDDWSPFDQAVISQFHTKVHEHIKGDVVEVLLGERRPADMAMLYGGTRDAWQGKVRRAHDTLRASMIREDWL